MTKDEIRNLLSEKLSKDFANNIAVRIADSRKDFPKLYALIYDEDKTISWRAAWVCDKLAGKYPDWFADKRSELMRLTMQCTHGGTKRSLLNVLLSLPVEEPISVEFLNFCLDHMYMPQEPIAIQALCIKMAYELCRKEPDLLPELKYILENTELDYYSQGVKSTTKNILKKIK